MAVERGGGLWRLVARAIAVIRIDAVWLATAPISISAKMIGGPANTRNQ